MKSRIAIAISALTLGTALAAVPSFAQTRDQTSGTANQGQSESCVHFQQGCSDKPYAMGQEASPNGAQTSERTAGARRNREARSASGGERINGERTSRTRERLSSERTTNRERMRVGERTPLSGSARVSERERTSDEYMRSTASEPGGAGERMAGREGVNGETYGFGERRDYYNAAPGAEIAGANRDATARCATRFQSFDPATGTYMGFDGMRHPCP